MIRRNHYRATLMAAAMALCPASAQAQGPPAKSSSVQEPAKPKPIEAGIELRWRPELRDNFDLKPADDFDGFSGLRIRLNLTARPHRVFSFFVQAQESEAFRTRGDKIIHDWDTNLHQAYFDWKIGGSEHWELRGGRQELIYGEERLVGAFGWDTVGRSFDAARLRQKHGAWSNDFFWGRMVDVRRNGAPARAAGQDLSGGYFSHARPNSPSRTEFYGLFLRDGLRTRGEIVTNPLQTTRIFTLGLRRVFQPKQGWRYSIENAWQFGERGPDTHRAAMLILSAGYAWASKLKPRLQFEYNFATGDNSPADGASREFNNLFPTNHIYYGYMDLIGLRNVHDFRGTAVATPHPKLTLEMDYHRFLLAEKRGPWKGATGRVLGSDPTGASGRDVGQEVDFTARLPLHKRFNLLGGYSFFVPGAYARRTRGPETQQWAYLQITVRIP